MQYNDFRRDHALLFAIMRSHRIGARTRADNYKTSLAGNPLASRISGHAGSRHLAATWAISRPTNEQPDPARALKRAARSRSTLGAGQSHGGCDTRKRFSFFLQILLY
jgi:hypothetical protein